MGNHNCGARSTYLMAAGRVSVGGFRGRDGLRGRDVSGGRCVVGRLRQVLVVSRLGRCLLAPEARARLICDIR